MRDATHTHTHTHSAPCLPPSLSSSLRPLVSPSLNCNPALGECLRLLLFCFPSPSCFICFRIPSPPIPYTPLPPAPLPPHARLLSGVERSLWQKKEKKTTTTIKRTFLLVSLKSATAQWSHDIYKKYKLCSRLRRL